MVDVAVVDYGMGNLRSVEQAMRKVAPGAEIAVSDNADVIANAKRVVFPGQGAMPDCMRELEARGLRDAVLEAARSKPFFGICIGMQMLFEHSDEGDVAGLGILRGKVVRFAGGMHDAQGNKLKVPHMGWNQVRRIEQSASPQGDATLAPSPSGGGLGRGSAFEHPLWDGIEQDARFYFVHSYYVRTQDASLIQATSNYPQSFVCAVAKDNLFAVQFHPEKSSTAGLKLLQNFVQWNP
ncbi:MAG: imidazole glycerol phosphate synthase, glutamine amidotransferase subunit [Betaproteobacteria bacterium RBG_16_56_24]|nr:MAG: imidazole glycerol phosphate synthase, glutamine amidotransferase subunit [Betaproteobacteria bacterium RBG_16_56_24]